jgi:hypothetical protein
VITTFDLWISRLGYDTFASIVNFINQNWFLCNITIGLFETPDISGVAFVEEVKVLLVEFNLTKKVITYVKDKGVNLNFLTTAFTSVVSYESLQLYQPFVGFCFGNAMSKTY